MYNNIKCKVIKKQLQHLENEETTYNFEVEDNHNYYVGENSVLVHNKCLKTTENVSTVDEALDKAEDFLGPSQSYYVNSKGEIEYNILVSDSDPRKVVRFDLDVTNSHVIEEGVHLNLEVYKHPFGTKGGVPKKNIHLKWQV